MSWGDQDGMGDKEDQFPTGQVYRVWEWAIKVKRVMPPLQG